jgi:hypothetical protein
MYTISPSLISNLQLIEKADLLSLSAVSPNILITAALLSLILRSFQPNIFETL